MNNKGFTLIELLATILILILVVGVTVVTSSNAFLSAKNNTEIAFIEELEKIVKGYIGSSSMNLTFSSSPTSYTTNNCDGNTCFIYKSTSTVTLQTLVNDGLVSTDKFINPKNETQCNLNTKIDFFRDSDYVYCFYIDLEEAGCYSGYVSNCAFASNIG